MAVFVAELKKLSEHCGYTDDQLKENLRDRLICGINNERWQKRLLTEDKADYQKVLDVALSLEAVEKGVNDLQAGTGSVNNLQGRHQSGAQLPKREGNRDAKACYRCGRTNHNPTECYFKEAVCRRCGIKGHIARACKNKLAAGGQPQDHRSTFGKKPQTRAHHLVDDQQDEADSDEYSQYALNTMSRERTKPMMVSVSLNGSKVNMEVDTGASLSVISFDTYQSLWPKRSAPALRKSRVKLSTYTGEHVPIAGVISVQVVYEDQQKELDLIVVQGKGPNLLGRDWLLVLRLDWSRLNQLTHSCSEKCHEIVDKHANVFKEELGLVQGVKAKLHVDPQAQPRFFKPRKVPYALRGKVEAELDRLESEGVIEKVPTSDWAAPIVPVVKQDGSVRICGDYKLTINQAAKTESYPLPRIEDIFASLSGGQSFTKLDLAHAYNQIELDDESKELVTINTSKGLYRYNRLPFGVASAPAIFQRTIENILQGIPNVSVYLDDILITGKTEEEHLRTLEEVLSRLEKAGIRLRRGKCAFMLKSLEYLGHRISGKGLQPTDKKVKAVRAAPAPTNLTQLKSFLGLINYYCKFMPNLSNTLSPLYRLLQKGTRWQWGKEQQDAFETAKSQLTTDRVLVHYDPTKSIILACDASPYGLGAVLSHKLDNGEEKPIAFASRSLAAAEKQYSQLEKEALAIVFGVRRFHQYLFGREFEILSDHKPLQGIYRETSGIPSMASARIQRWALTLSAYNYRIKFKAGKENSNADLLSRLPLPETPTQVPDPGETVLLMEALNSSVVTAAQVKAGTVRDPVLAQVMDALLQGKSLAATEQLQPYRARMTELSIQDGCILRGTRVIVPPSRRSAMVDLLHESHPGMCKLKALARSYVWWPGIDEDLEAKVRNCVVCQESRPLDRPVPIHPWEWPQKPWSRLHLDYAGPLFGKMYLVLIDAHSKWIEAKGVSSATSAATIEQLTSIFSVHGLPEVLVTDNGSCFTSTEFKEFIKQNGIHHICTAPYHPASNGQAERAVKIIKDSLKRATQQSRDMELSKFLFHYRLTPHTTTGIAPAELLLGRRPRSCLDLVKPDLSQQVQRKQLTQVANRGGRADKQFDIGSAVLAKNFSSGRRWLEGTILHASGPASFTIELTDGRVIRRHVNHIRPGTTQTQATPVVTTEDWTDLVPSEGGRQVPELAEEEPAVDPAAEEPAVPVPRHPRHSSAPPTRRSTRPRVRPDYYGH